MDRMPRTRTKLNTTLSAITPTTAKTTHATTYHTLFEREPGRKKRIIVSDIHAPSMAARWWMRFVAGRAAADEPSTGWVERMLMSDLSQKSEKSLVEFVGLLLLSPVPGVGNHRCPSEVGKQSIHRVDGHSVSGDDEVFLATNEAAGHRNPSDRYVLGDLEIGVNVAVVAQWPKEARACELRGVYDRSSRSTAETERAGVSGWIVPAM